MTNKDTIHPWQEFLDARAKAIIWMSEEMRFYDKNIAANISLDEEQVCSIRKYLQSIHKESKLPNQSNSFPKHDPV